MANVANVRFYKLNVLPNFEAKHEGIFVHVAETMHNKPWTPTNYPKEVNPATLLITTAVKEEEKIYLSTWLSKRHIENIESGLWFGGKNGWELLSNETNSAAIDAAIDAKINALNAGGFTQATIGANTEVSESATDSILKIKGIKETKGKIEQDSTKDVSIAIDGVYNETSNKIATQSTVTNAINGLNTTETIQAVTKTTETNGNTTLTFNGVQETNGVIAQGTGNETLTVGDAKLQIQIGSATTDVFSANAQSNGAIKLDGLVFKKDNNNVISVITPTAVALDNRLVTEKDVANLAGAMHYKGTVSSLQDFQNKLGDSDAEEAGDVYIATGIPEGSFTHNGNVIENGDMIVFNSASEYKVVQSNLTLGTKGGQIAKNDGDLSPNNNVVIATSAGIKTIGITEDDLTGTTNGNNSRTLSIANGTGDTTGEITLYHDVTISDALKVIGKDFTETIKISSTNRSIEIANNGNTGVVVDLVWNTSMDPDPNTQL